jgi:hypothetical protein
MATSYSQNAHANAPVTAIDVHYRLGENVKGSNEGLLTFLSQKARNNLAETLRQGKKSIL